jgi:hypothetical protein
VIYDITLINGQVEQWKVEDRDRLASQTNLAEEMEISQVLNTGRTIYPISSILHIRPAALAD